MGGSRSTPAGVEAARQHAEQQRRDSEAKSRQTALEQMRKERIAAMEQGQRRGRELFGDEALGRVREGRSEDIQEVIRRRRSALEGLSAPEAQAMRERAQLGLQQQTQQALRALRGIQGQAGIRGGMQAAQQAKLLTGEQLAREQMERELMLENIRQRQQALGAFEESATGAEQSELARRQMNLEQLRRERMGQLATEMGFGGLQAAESGAASQQAIGQAMAEAARAQSPTGGKK